MGTIGDIIICIEYSIDRIELKFFQMLDKLHQIKILLLLSPVIGTVTKSVVGNAQERYFNFNKR